MHLKSNSQVDVILAMERNCKCLYSKRPNGQKVILQKTYVNVFSSHHKMFNLKWIFFQVEYSKKHGNYAILNKY